MRSTPMHPMILAGRILLPPARRGGERDRGGGGSSAAWGAAWPRLPREARTMTETFDPLLILAPPAAFLIYLMLVTALAGAGRYLAGPAKATALKTSTYASGEAPPQTAGAPGDP